MFSNPEAISFRKCSSFAAIFLSCLALAPCGFAADISSLDDATVLLAERVSAIPNLRGPLRLEFNDEPGLAGNPGSAWRETFRRELEARHLNVTEDPAAPLLRVAVTATPTQLILVASARPKDRDEVRFVSFSRASIRPASLSVAPMRIDRQLLLERPERILDASSFGNDSENGIELLAYRNGELSVLQLDASGAVKQSVSLAAAALHPSRDPQGELSVHESDTDVSLPGKTCTFVWAAGGDVKCRSAKTVWRSATVLTPACDPAGWKVVSEGRDWAAPEMLQVVPDDAAREGRAAVLSEFPGPVLNVNGEQNPSSALVVARNLRSGNYEVYRITLACGH